VPRGYGGAGLVLGCRKGETIVIGDGPDRVFVTVVATGVNGGKAQLAINAPADVEIERVSA
jgi:sRNA-binding carbon storage regulator CsrA